VVIIMEIFKLLIFLLVILGFYFFYVYQKYLWVGLAILADLAILGFIASGAWPLILITGIPVTILNYFAFQNIVDANKK